MNLQLKISICLCKLHIYNQKWWRLQIIQSTVAYKRVLCISTVNTIFITFTFEQISLGMVWTPLSSQLWAKKYHYCSSRRIALALNNLKRVDMPLKIENQTNTIFLWSLYWLQNIQKVTVIFYKYIIFSFSPIIESKNRQYVGIYIRNFYSLYDCSPPGEGISLAKELITCRSRNAKIL